MGNDRESRKLTYEEAAKLGLNLEEGQTLAVDAGMTDEAIRYAIAMQRDGVTIAYRGATVAVTKAAVSVAFAEVAMMDEDERERVRASVQRAMDAFVKRQTKAEKRGKLLPKEAFDNFYGDALLWHALQATEGQA